MLFIPILQQITAEGKWDRKEGRPWLERFSSLCLSSPSPVVLIFRSPFSLNTFHTHLQRKSLSDFKILLLQLLLLLLLLLLCSLLTYPVVHLLSVSVCSSCLSRLAGDSTGSVKSSKRTFPLAQGSDFCHCRADSYHTCLWQRVACIFKPCRSISRHFIEIISNHTKQE